MDKKKLLKDLEQDDIKGFEEFIEGQQSETHFLPKGAGGSTKKDTGFEHFTFLSNDAERLTKLKHLLTDKLPFATRFDQSAKLIHEQKEEITLLKEKLFEAGDQVNSPYRRSLAEIFDSFFEPPKA